MITSEEQATELKIPKIAAAKIKYYIKLCVFIIIFKIFFLS